MTTIAATAVALTVVGPYTTPAGTGYDEQANTAAGNKFVNARGTILVTRNATTALAHTFYADIYGVETPVLACICPASSTETGISVHGPFPAAVFNDHSTTVAAGTAQGTAVFASSGSNSNLLCCPLQLNLGLL